MQLSAAYMSRLQTRLDMIGNNMANVNTPGFKEQLRAFEESYDLQDRSLNNAMFGRPVGNLTGGEGPLYTGMRLNMNPGTLQVTGSPLDLAITGEGFFQVYLPNGMLGYTRVGHFLVDQDGTIVTPRGLVLEPPMAVPEDATDLIIGADGVVTVRMPGEVDADGGIIEGEIVELGQILLARFDNPNGLNQIGSGVFLATVQSGDPIVGLPQEEGRGSLVPGSLEQSNTDLASNMVDMINVQRAYQLKSRSIRTQDEMLATTVSMRG